MIYHDNPEYNDLITKINEYYIKDDADEIDRLNEQLRKLALADEDVYGQLISRYIDTFRLFIERKFDQLTKDLLTLLVDLKAMKMDYYIMKTYNSLAIIESELASYYESLSYYLNAYRIALRNPDYAFTTAILNNIGNLFVWLGEYEPSLPYMIEAYHTYFREHCDDEDLLATVVVNIIEVYSCMNCFDEADKWFDVKIKTSRDDRLIVENIRLCNEFIRTIDIDDDKKESLLDEIFKNMENCEDYIYQFRVALRLLDACIKMKRKEDCDRLMRVMDHMNEGINNMDTFLYDYSVLKVRYRMTFHQDLDGNEIFMEYYERSLNVLQQMRNTYTNSLMVQLTLDRAEQEKEDMESINSELKHTIKIDNFTRLYNKTALIDCVETSIRLNKFNYEQALIILDIDHFKHVNDHYGHQVGDEVLLKVATLLKGMAGDNIDVGRFGGDEFIIFMKDCQDVSELLKLLEDLIEKGRSIKIIENEEEHITLSVGVAHSNEKSFQDYFVKADEALYESKKQGRNQYTIYS